MTSRQMYEALLIEMNKTDAPNILLEDFNYFANKAIYQYINKRYNIYDINQQTTDDLRVLKATAKLSPKIMGDYYDGLTNASKMATYECILPSDYLHMLNCICIYNVNKTFKCYNKGDKYRAAAKRLTADAYSQVLDNFWNRPTYKKPYYYIHNININNNIPTEYIPTNPYNKENGGTDVTISKSIIEENINITDNDISGTIKNFVQNIENENADNYEIGDLVAVIPSPLGTNTNTGILYERISGRISWREFIINDIKDNIYKYSSNYYQIKSKLISNNTIWEWVKISSKGSQSVEDKDSWNNSIANTSASGNFTGIKIGDNNYISNVERGGEIRYGNASQVRMEIRYGTDNTVFTLDTVLIDYIKAPQNIRLTQEQLDWTEDRSQVLEYPDYVCQEIINELVHIVMENIGDPKLQTHPIVSQSIANPAQQQTEPVAQAT